jgi:hypothetical protein
MEEIKPEDHAKPELVESPTIGKLIMALAKAQGQIKAAPKDSDNPFFKSKYADLASVWDACREPLAKNGLAVIQRPNPTDGATVSLTTILAHESGEWIRGTLVMRPVKADPQGIGSCLTYARRYALSAMVGICSEEDDDGNKASQKSRTEESTGPDKELMAVGKVADVVKTSNPKFVTVNTGDLKLGTGDVALIDIALAAKDTGEEVRFHYVINGRFTDLTAIDRREPPAKPAAPPAERTGPVAQPDPIADMSPSAGHEIATGLVTAEIPTKAPGYRAWGIEGQQTESGADMAFATKDKALNALMADYMKTQHKVKVEYKRAAKAGMASIIYEVRSAPLDSIPY